MTRVSLRNVSKYYKQKKVLCDINLELEDSKIYVIMGKSGEGKSTLLNIIGLLDNMSSGELYINGSLVKNLNDNQKANLRMNTLGFVFQSFYLNPKLKAYENVMVPMYINKSYKNINLKERALKLLKILDLEKKYNYFPKELSGGEQQRVSIARAISNDAQIILADEPTGNLDSENEKIVLDYFRYMADCGKTIVIVTHNESVLKYADKVYYLKDSCLEERQYEF